MTHDPRESRVRAARLIELGQPLRVEDIDLPEPGPGEVRVELAFGGVNPIDRYQALGRANPDGPRPRTLGGEASGHVDGEPVLAAGGGLGMSRDGVWASAANVPESSVVPIPEGVDLSVAAAMGIAGLTAWNVVARGEIGPSDRVLVLGASGGVGLPIVSLAASSGAQVWGQTGRDDKTAVVTEFGADRVIVADAAGLADSLGDFRPTVVLDPLGSSYTHAALQAMAPGGRLVSFGTSAGAEANLNLQTVYRNGLTILGYGGFLVSEDERRLGLAAAFAALAEDRLRIRVDRVMPLDEVNLALDLLGDRAVTGKVVLALS